MRSHRKAKCRQTPRAAPGAGQARASTGERCRECRRSDGARCSATPSMREDCTRYATCAHGAAPDVQAQVVPERSSRMIMFPYRAFRQRPIAGIGTVRAFAHRLVPRQISFAREMRADAQSVSRADSGRERFQRHYRRELRSAQHIACATEGRCRGSRHQNSHLPVAMRCSQRLC